MFVDCPSASPPSWNVLENFLQRSNKVDIINASFPRCNNAELCSKALSCSVDCKETSPENKIVLISYLFSVLQLGDTNSDRKIMNTVISTSLKQVFLLKVFLVYIIIQVTVTVIATVIFTWFAFVGDYNTYFLASRFKIIF